jgi:serine/threonine protein kinase
MTLQPIHPDAEMAPLPERVGTVRVVALLGHGSMGEVYRGHDDELGRDVAVKLLTIQDAEGFGRFQREALALGRLSHPNVVGVHHKGIFQDRPYFIMELVDGPSVAKILEQQGCFSVPEAAEIIRQAANGLNAAAEAGVIHRDIKPGNLLVAKDGTVKVADFGVCKISDRGPSWTEQGTTLGTPFYMAPEQARGESVDARADQYALGATFYHLLCGCPPYAGTQTVTQLLAHQKEPVPDVRKVNPSVPVSVAKVIRRMLAKNPAHRYANYDELLDHLDAALLHSPRAWSKRTLALAGALAASVLLAALPPALSAPDEPPTLENPQTLGATASPQPVQPVPPQAPAPAERPLPPPTTSADKEDALRTQIAADTGPGRVAAMRAFARTRHAEVRPTLERILLLEGDPDAPMAAFLLGERGEQAASQALVKSLESSRRATVLAAVDALVRLRDIRAVVPLQKLGRTHADATVRVRAKRSGDLLFRVEREP